MSERGDWIAVACAEHVARGRALGFVQVNHGKAAPLRRLRAGDRVAYYSPSLTLGGTQKCQAFTAFGTVRDEAIDQADMGNGFRPFRRAVAWRTTADAPIRPLLDRLDLTRGKRNWGYGFRFGLVRVCAADMDLIAAAMLGLPNVAAEIPLERGGADL